MDFQQKAQALNALSLLSIRLREGGDWYVNTGIEIKDKSMLSGVTSSSSSPEGAVNQYWDKITEQLAPRKYLVVNAYRANRRAVRWNGFMWADVFEDLPKEPKAEESKDD